MEIISNLDDLLERKYERISLGLDPSGPIHLGTALVFLQAFLAMQKNPETELNISITDLGCNRQRGKSFISYLNQKDPSGCHELMKEHTKEETENLVSELSSYFGIESKVNLSYFSDLTEKKELQKIFLDLFSTEKGREKIRRTVLTGSDRSSTLLSPICICGYSSNKPPKFNGTELRTRCYNEKCGVDYYGVDLRNLKSVNISYLLDTIRDLIPPKANLHIFGGDYGENYGEDKLPKAERILNLLSSLSENPPRIYVGPLVEYNGEKIGKSKRNGLSVESLRNKYPDWIERMHHLLRENPGERLDLLELNNYF